MEILAASCIFNVNGLITTILFFKLAYKWQKILNEFIVVEILLENYEYRENLFRKFNFTVGTITTAAVIEHILAVFNTYKEISPNLQYSRQIVEYFHLEYPFVFKYINFSSILATCVFVSQKTNNK